MVQINQKNGRGHVLEMANRASIQKLSVETVSGLTIRLDSHESGLNTNAHGIPNIAGLQTALGGKEPAFSKNTAFNKNFGSTSGTVCQGNDSRLSDARTPTAHSHAISDVTGLQTALDGKSDTGHGHVIGDVTGLQEALDSKQDTISGYTGSITVITGVDFVGETVATSVLSYSNGILISIA